MSCLVERFLDGTKPDQSYLDAVHRLIGDACAAEEAFSIDELEEHARHLAIQEAHRKVITQQVDDRPVSDISFSGE